VNKILYLSSFTKKNLVVLTCDTVIFAFFTLRTTKAPQNYNDFDENLPNYNYHPYFTEIDRQLKKIYTQKRDVMLGCSPKNRSVVTPYRSGGHLALRLYHSIENINNVSLSYKKVEDAVPHISAPLHP